MVGRNAGPKGVIAFTAARELVKDGLTAPNGYTEGVLCKYRLEVKALGTASAPRKMRLKKRGGTKESAALKALRIATGIAKRTAKDITYDEKECAQKREKLEKMRADGADSHDISKQEEMLVESTTSLARSQEKIVGARAELSALVEQSSGDAEATASPLYAAALEVLESSK
jgi:tubulin-specific chaperone A